jgi:hypothetical protein
MIVSSTEDLAWYASQSPVTSPGELEPLLTDLSPSIEELRRVAHGLVIHYRVDNPLQAGIPQARLAEIDTRYGERMLARLSELKDGALVDARAPSQRLVGCCRDFTVLLLAMARAAGIPARGRVGFARYFVANFWVDHEVAEVWDADGQRWRLIDAELDEHHVDPTDGQSLDPLDLPRDRFLVAGAAWKLCRGGAADPETFLVDPAVEVEGTRGWPYLQHNLILDLAALNKMEMLLWDAWGLADRHSTDPHDLELLDRIAQATDRPDPSRHDLRTLYAADARLPVPSTVTSYDPLGGPPRRVAVADVPGGGP